MRIRLWVAVGCVIGGAAAAAAQQPGYGYPQGGYGYGYGMGGLGPPAVMPNIYNPRTQPLSPYLNLARGGNLATNYYYGVRPGTVGGAGSMGGGVPAMAMGGQRGLFFPQLAVGGDPGADPNAVQPTNAAVLPPAGHPAVFGNTMGYYPGSMNQAGRRPGLSGIGAGGSGGRVSGRR